MGALDEFLGGSGVSRSDPAFQITREKQRKMDQGRMEILQQELADEQQKLAAGDPRAQANIDAIKREMGSSKAAPVSTSALDDFLNGVEEPAKPAQVRVEVRGGQQPQQVQPPRQVQQMPEAQAPSVADKLIGLGELGLTAVTGTVAPVIGGVAGVAKNVFGGTLGTQEGLKQAEKTAGEVSEALTYQPRTEAGKAVTGKALGALQEAFEASKLPPVMPEALPAAGISKKPSAKAELETTFAKKVAPVAKRVEPVMEPVTPEARKNVQMLRQQQPIAEPKITTEVPVEKRTFSVPEEQPPIVPKQSAESLAKSNEEKLAKVGMTSFRKSALTQNPKEATSQYVTAKSSQETYGHGMTEQINHEKSALNNHFGEIEKSSGGHVVRYGTAEQQGDLIKEGKTIKSALKEGIDAYNAETSNLYKEAEKSFGDKPVNLNNFNDYLKADDQFAYAEEKNLQSAINSFVKRKGFMDEQGNVRPLTVAESEEIRQFINSKYHYDTREVAKNLKSKLDDDVFSQVGGETYQKARAHFRAGKETYDNPKSVSNLLADENVNQKISDEKVMANILATDQSQFNHLINTLRKDGKDKAIAQIQTSLVNKIKRAGHSEVNEPWNSRAAAKEAASLSEKLKVAFADNPELLSKIYDGIEAGNIVYIPTKYPGAAVQSHLLKQKFSEIALKKAGTATGASAGAAIGGVTGAGVGGFIGEKIGTAGAEKLRERRQAKQLRKEIKLRDIGK